MGTMEGCWYAIFVVRQKKHPPLIPLERKGVDKINVSLKQNYEALASAIIRQAVVDYQKGKKSGIKRFLTSPSGEFIINYLGYEPQDVLKIITKT